MIDRLSSIAVLHPRVVVATWAGVFIAGLVTAGTLFSTLDADLDGSPRLESEQVDRRLAELDPSGRAVDDAVYARLEAIPGAESVQHTASADGAATAIAVELTADLPDGEHERSIDDIVEALRAIDAPQVLVGGELLLDEEVAELAERDAQRAETISLPIALIVLAVVFGGVLAAGVPLALALSGVTATMIVLGLVSSLTEVSLYALNVTIMLGLGLGIDYGLLVVSRLREEMARGAAHDAGIEPALRRTMRSAGRTVVFSASTVAVALVGLLVFDDPTIRSLGMAGIAVVLLCMLAALTLMPAMLRLMGHRLRARRMPDERAAGHGWFATLARVIQRRALPVAIAVALGLLVLAAPVAGARFDDLGAKVLPRSSETRAVAEAIDARFPHVAAEPIAIIANVAADDAELAGYLGTVAALAGVDSVAEPEELRDGTTLVEVHVSGRANGPESQRVVGEVRAIDAPFAFAVGGDPAEIVDFRESITSRLPYAAAIIAVATFALLFWMTGSVLLPLKAIVMNLLSLGATFGVLVWLFQDGHFAGVLGFDAPGALDLVMPVIIFVFAFGLSMDYEVFLLERIREEWLATHDYDHAVAVGLQRCGRIITSAALLIVIVFAGFAAGEIVAMKQLGVGLAVAVVIDATVVRTLLVPATMKLHGDWNWWSPTSSRRRQAMRAAGPVRAVRGTGRLVDDTGDVPAEGA